MDGKVLILCDEKPGDYDGYSVKDRNYLISTIITPDEELEKIFVCWDSIIPEDRSFIEMCKQYASFKEKPNPLFAISQTGATDSRSGTLKSSVQEQSYFDTYQIFINYLSNLKQNSEDFLSEAIDLSVQFPYDANQRFFEDFSEILNQNNIVTILPAYSKTTEQTIFAYRMQMLEAWQNVNKFMSAEIKSVAKVTSPMIYVPDNAVKKEGDLNFYDVYNKAQNELFKIYSMPIFGEENDDERS